MKRSLPVVVILALLAASCGKSPTGPRVTQVTVTPSSASFTAIGETIQFSAVAMDASGNQVTGVTPKWSTSDSTVVTVASDGTATAVGAGLTVITATVSGVPAYASVSVTISIASAPCTDTMTMSLSAGQFTSLDASGTSTCILLPSGSSGDEYRVAVVNTSTSETSDTSEVSLQENGVGVTAAPPVQGERAAIQVLGGLTPQQAATLNHALQIQRATERAHAAMRAKERAMFESLLAQGPVQLLPTYPKTFAGVSAAAASSPAKRTFYTSTTCTNTSQKATGVLVYDTTNVVFYQDSAQNATSPVKQSDVATMASYFSSYAVAMIRSYFGQIPDIDGNGKIIVFISPVVGSGEAAFVWAGDFLPTSGTNACPASNQGEIVYFSNSVIGSMDNGDYQALETLAHETKHVVSLYNRLEASIAANASEFEPTWVEEGTAEISGEMSSRIAWAANGGPPVNAQVTRADLQTGTGGINVTPYDYGVLLRLSRTISYLSSQPNSLTSTPLGADSASNVYGSGWHFHRWLGDAYGGAATSPEADSSLFRQLVDSLTPPEPGALQAITGKTFTQLLEEYAAAVSLVGTGAPQPTRAFTTYDFLSATSNLLQSQPAGLYPWPVTGSSGPAGFQGGVYQGPIGNSGIRVHDFVSNGTGTGAVIQVTTVQPSVVVVVRLQ